MTFTAQETSFLLEVADGLGLFIHRWTPVDAPKAVIQIAHGIAEHGGRYGRLASALTVAGYVVYANDHRGHGRTARAAEDVGFFAEQNGWQKCVDDLWRLNRQISTNYPGLPIILLGHSMGSFLTQHFIIERGNALAGAVLSGSSGKLPPATAGLLANLGTAKK